MSGSEFYQLSERLASAAKELAATQSKIAELLNKYIESGMNRPSEKAMFTLRELQESQRMLNHLELVSQEIRAKADALSEAESNVFHNIFGN